IIHRDLKPENIIIHSLSPPLIKVADWGLRTSRPPARNQLWQSSLWQSRDCRRDEILASDIDPLARSLLICRLVVDVEQRITVRVQYMPSFASLIIFVARRVCARGTQKSDG
ncbi:hypothetical protein OG21DRAFT_1427349, partial [Imleria badia]